MSRSLRTSEDDLAYGDIPHRWDRDRFERAGRDITSSLRTRENSHLTGRDRPGKRDVSVVDRIDEIDHAGFSEKRDRIWEDDRYTSRPRRRTDRELFGDVDPREIAHMSLAPYRRSPSRPGLLRRQSSLDSFNRGPSRYEREEWRLPSYEPIPLPIRREHRPPPEDYREVEITREHSVHRNSLPRGRSSSGRSEHHSSKSQKSHIRSRTSSISSSSSNSISEASKEESIRESIVDIKRKFKRGKTRMPKRLVRREAIMDLAYPFDEEENFFILKVALEKEQIDEVIKISEIYKNKSVEEKTVVKLEEKIDQPSCEREEITRTEWINPPSVASRTYRSRSARPPSPSTHSTITRRISPGRTLGAAQSHTRSRAPSSTFHEERRTVIETSPAAALRPPVPDLLEERKPIIEERPFRAFPGHQGVLVVKDRDHRSDRDIHAEIRSLENERRALRLERDADERRDLALRIRPDDSHPIATYREGRPLIVETFGRDSSPPRNIVRVEKDRKVRKRRNRKAVAVAVATLT